MATPTIIGTVGKFGFDSDQTGIILESQDIDYKPDTKVQRNYQGVKVGIIFYDDQTDVTLKGWIPRSDSMSIAVGSTLTLANAADAYGLEDPTAGTTVITGAKTSYQNEDIATLEVSATIYNFTDTASV